MLALRSPRSWRFISDRQTFWLLSLFTCIALVACNKSPQEQAIDHGFHYLVSMQRADGAICDSVNPLFDTWETVEAATAIWECYGDTSNSVLKKALNFLKTQENSAGLLCHNVKCKASYCLETTSEYFILLADIYGKAAIQDRMDTISRLQKPTGEWEIGNPDVLENKSYPSVTAFVLAAYVAADVPPPNHYAACEWLVKQKDPAGHWGANWEYYGCEAYAFWPMVRALQQQPYHIGTTAAQLAVEYINRHMVQFSHWDATTDSSKKHVSGALQTALMLNALAGHDDLDSRISITAGTQYLLEQQQPDGRWDGGFFPIANQRYEKREDVFATARAMVAIHAEVVRETGE